MSQLQIRPSQSPSSTHSAPSDSFLADLGSRSFASLAQEASSTILPGELPTAALAQFVNAHHEMLAKNANAPANERLTAHRFDIGGETFFAINQHTVHEQWGRESAHAEIFDATGKRIAEVQQTGQGGHIDAGGTSARLRNDPTWAKRQEADRGTLEAQLNGQQALERYRDQITMMPVIMLPSAEPHLAEVKGHGNPRKGTPPDHPTNPNPGNPRKGIPPNHGHPGKGHPPMHPAPPRLG